MSLCVCVCVAGHGFASYIHWAHCLRFIVDIFHQSVVIFGTIRAVRGFGVVVVQSGMWGRAEQGGELSAPCFWKRSALSLHCLMYSSFSRSRCRPSKGSKSNRGVRGGYQGLQWAFSSGVLVGKFMRMVRRLV